MTKFEPGDVIDDEYIVIDSFTLDQKEYIYAQFNENETTFLEVYEENGENYIRNIDDDSEFERVMMFFTKKTEKLIEND